MRDYRISVNISLAVPGLRNPRSIFAILRSRRTTTAWRRGYNNLLHISHAKQFVIDSGLEPWSRTDRGVWIADAFFCGLVIRIDALEEQF